MRCVRFCAQITFAAVLTVVQDAAHAQITSNKGDGVLNAPYRGTIDSLRECTMDLGYGEVKSHVEPFSGSSACITSGTIDVWAEGDWDRSVLRLFQGIDASGDEIDLTGTSEFSPVYLSAGSDAFVRFSLKATGTKTLAPLTFTVTFYYKLSTTFVGCDPWDGYWTTATRTFRVAPITGAGCGAPVESEAFHFGTSLLDVSVGNATLTVPVGRTAEMIGATFIDKDNQLGPSVIQTTDVLLPGTAESLYIQNWSQFRLFGGSSGPSKTTYGTPWPGHLIGYYASGDVWGPDGTHFDSLTSTSSDFRRFDRIRPVGLSEFHSATVNYVYDDSFNNRVIEINDQATTPNIITLHRTAGVVTRITTSDGRGWNIESAPVGGWITGVVPDGGKDARYFTYTPDPADPDAVPRVAQVKDAEDNLMYQFDYQLDGDDVPVELTAERRFVDGALQTVIEHDIVSESLRRRKEYVGPGEFRQYDFAYDTEAMPNPLNHRLMSITSYSELNGGGTPYTTTYTNDVDNADGTMVITRVDLPDGTWIDHEYDSHVDAQAVHFGFRTKSTHSGPTDGSLVTYDADYEFFYPYGATTRLFHRPRIVKQRDGRGALSEVTFDYENGDEDENFDGLYGEKSNQFLKRTGPTIALGTSGVRRPETRYTYDTTDRVLVHQETDYASGMFRVVEYGYDELLRRTSQTVDPGGENLVTQYQYFDDLVTQDRVVIDPDDYYTKQTFDNDGRVRTTQRFLTAGGTAGNFYQTENEYDINGRLFRQKVDNKDQDGNPIPGETNPIITEYTYDRLGRLMLRMLDSGGIGQEANFDYNWLSDVEREFDTSGRGTKRVYDGRGLVESETPLALNETPDTNLTTTFECDAVGNRTFTYPPTHPAGPHDQRVYDDFSRPKQIKRQPGTDGGNLITTTFEYDDASNVMRTLAEEAGVGVLSDSTNEFDEGSFNYESRQRTVAGVDGPEDPVSQRRFDWAGNVIEEKSLGDATVGDRIITTIYNGANRVERIQDSEGGETIYGRDGRGNVEVQTVKLNASDSAVTTTVYDAMSRAVQVTDPEDSVGGRPDRIRKYDSRGNLRRETMRDTSDAAVMANVFAYDAASRQTRSAVLVDASSTIDASAANPAIDRVVDFQYDADGRLALRTRYNNDTATPFDTVTVYDGLGRVDQVTDPSSSYTAEDYGTHGRLTARHVFDGVGVRMFTFEYDGCDRVKMQTAAGTPERQTQFEYDGLDRQTLVTSPRGIKAKTEYDLVGRREKSIEDYQGALERETALTYNRQSQLVEQRAQNKDSGGGALADQITTYRYDTLARQTRTVYPDAPSGDHNDPNNCTDCIRTVYDDAGRMTQRQDQRNTTDYAYDDRGLLLTRTTGTTLDTFDYDALGRMVLADRGTTTVIDAVSSSDMSYTGLGNLDFEIQTIAQGTPRTIDYAYDQAGNRTRLDYPAGTFITYVPTVLNQADQMNVSSGPQVDYIYRGHLLDKRRATTDAPGSDTVYEVQMGYNSHRWITGIANRLETPVRAAETIAHYTFSHDNHGNPLTQTVSTGMANFTADDREFTVDRLDRLTRTDYLENGQFEYSTLDLIGNRESHTDRTEATTYYTLANPANEYATVGGTAVQYDATGNLSVDEDGRQYFYDEQNRLIQIKASDDTVLANYEYDAIGRRIVFEDPVAGTPTHYYYDGQSVIEERNGGDALLRYHVNGAQYIDERIATYEESGSLRSPGFTYYLLNSNYSIAGTGNADGSVIGRLDYSATGDFRGGGPGASSYYHDADEDIDIDMVDFLNFQVCFDQSDPDCLTAHDFDTVPVSDGDIDLDDFAKFVECFNGPFITPSQDCDRSGSRGNPPPSGTFALHGRPIDVLSDGHVLFYIRARYYDPRNGRWLQRDPVGYADAGNLYESFAGNAVRFVDPSGRWMAKRIAEILRDKGRITVGDIRRLGEDLNSSPRNQIVKLTEEELQFLRIIGGTARGTPWTESNLSGALRKQADEDFGFLAPPYRYRVQANLSTRRRMLYILLFQNQAFSNYVTDLYRVSRDFNPVHFAAERGIQVGTGVEMVTGQKVSRIRAAGEFVVYLALLKGFQAGPRLITRAAGGEVPGITAVSSTSTGTGKVRVYRVEGAPNTRIAIDQKGGVIIIDNTKTLFLNFGSRARAEAFFAQKLGQGLPDANIKSFEVRAAFLSELRAAAVTEARAAMAPDRPLVVDVTKAPDQFGLRPEQIKALQDAIILGTGRVEP